MKKKIWYHKDAPGVITAIGKTTGAKDETAILTDAVKGPDPDPEHYFIDHATDPPQVKQKAKAEIDAIMAARQAALEAREARLAALKKERDDHIPESPAKITAALEALFPAMTPAQRQFLAALGCAVRFQREGGI